MENQPDERFRNSCEGMLLYPTVNKTLTASYTDKGRVISIRTIKLDQSWQGIHDDLVALVARKYDAGRGDSDRHRPHPILLDRP